MADRIDFGTKDDWARVHDAYGPATKAREDLKNLMSPFPGTRDKAVWNLYGNLFHQGGRFRATRKAVPVLYDVLARPDCPSKPFILRYLVALAHGYAEEFLPFGVDASTHAAALQAQSDGDGPAVEFYCDPDLALDIYDLVQARRVELAPHAADADPAVAVCAMYAAAWLAADDPDARAAIAARAQDSAADVRRSAWSCWALAERAVGLRDRLDALAPWLAADDPVDRFAAAVASVEADTVEALGPALLAGLGAWPVPKGDDALSKALRETWGLLPSVATGLIRRHVRAPTDAWLAIHEAALAKVADLSKLAIVADLLRFVLPRQTRGGFKGIASADLTPHQRRALRAVVEHGVWLDEGSFLNFTELLKNFGLPQDRDSLRVYAEE